MRIKSVINDVTEKLLSKIKAARAKDARAEGE